jgi:hypothetical protein
MLYPVYNGGGLGEELVQGGNLTSTLDEHKASDGLLQLAFLGDLNIEGAIKQLLDLPLIFVLCAI